MLLSHCQYPAVVVELDEEYAEEEPVMPESAPATAAVEAPAEPEEVMQIPLTTEETEDLQKVLTPLCEAQADIEVYYHGIEYMGDKPLTVLLGTISPQEFQALAAATHSVATGEVTDDFERYTFGSLQGQRVEAYISRSNREYGIELTDATAVYAPRFHDIIQELRKNLVLPPPTPALTAKNTQH